MASVGDLERRSRASPLGVPVAHAVGGLAAAVLVLALDDAVGGQRLPAWLQVDPGTARASLVGLVTSFIFVISVVFWVRIWAVQMSASPVLARVLSQFLTDRVQQHAMGFIVGAITYGLTVVRSVPDDGSGVGSVPHLAVTVAYVMAVVVAVLIIFVVNNAARWGQVGHLIRQITDESVAHVRAAHPPLGSGADGVGSGGPAPAQVGGRGVVHAHQNGWVQAIDEDLLLAGLPAGSTVELAVRVGWFVIEGSPLAMVSTDDHDHDHGERAVRQAIRMGPEPSLGDVEHAVRELTDIAQRAMSPPNRDSTSAREAVFGLGIIVRELLLRDLPASSIDDGEGRRLVRTRSGRLGDYCQAAFSPIRNSGAASVELMEALLTVIGMLVAQLDEEGLHDRTAILREQAGLAVDAARDHIVLAPEFDRVCDVARSWNLIEDADSTPAANAERVTREPNSVA